MSDLLPGVYTARKKDGTLYFRSSITYRGKHISLGSFSTEAAAHEAYLTASALLADASLSVNDYSASAHGLSFEKWVVLCNFRDNGVYISNPIYVRPRIFYYYFSPDDFFIFSSEDLFYYSAHSIQRRGGHFFVADYGSQISLYSRYGIHSHSVCGRDYVFLDGNPQDLQYTNVKIINSYHGVIREKDRYTARIHIRGYLKIGTYDSAVEAAVAYNKASDILKEAGLTRQFPVNYIDGLSARSYADIYSAVKISDSVTGWSNQ